MDYSLIATASSAIGAARDIAKAAIGIRDTALVAVKISEISDQLLKAQDSLFAHNAQLHALQQENFSLTNRLRELEGKKAQRSRYALIEISDGSFVLSTKGCEKLPAENPADELILTEPDHYACQPCLDIRGHLVVLQKAVVFGAETFTCPACKTEFTGRHVGA